LRAARIANEGRSMRPHHTSPDGPKRAVIGAIAAIGIAALMVPVTATPSAAFTAAQWQHYIDCKTWLITDPAASRGKLPAKPRGD
jgi:hypothetical protein